MSRFTLAAVAEMMDYRNPTSYECQVQPQAATSAEPSEAQGMVEWMLQTDHISRNNNASSSRMRN